MEVHYGPINAEGYTQLLQQRVLPSRWEGLQYWPPPAITTVWVGNGLAAVHTSHRLKSPAAALLSSNIQFVFYVQLWIKYLSEVFELVYIIFIYILHSVTTFGEPGAVYRCCINGGKCSIVKTLVDFKYWRTKHHYESSLSRVWSISWLTSDPRAPLSKLFSNPITGHKMRI